MNNLEKILRSQTNEMFSDKWYEKTSNLLCKVNDENYGYVYFVTGKNKKYVKIGMSSNLNSRLKNLKTGMSDGLYVYGFIYTKDYVKIEKELHKNYLDVNVQGEWFDLLPKDCIDLIKSYKGLVVDKFFVKKSKVIDGMTNGFQSQNSDALDEYYSKMYDYFETLKRGDKIKKETLRDAVRLLDKKFEVLSNRKITVILKKWVEMKSYQYKLFNSNGNFSFILY